MESLRSEWDAATSFAAGDVSERWWEVVCTQYSGEGRVFHNHSYLELLFVQYNKYKDKLSQPQAVACAIFFHKLEYNPRFAEDTKNKDKFEEFISAAGEGQQDTVVSGCVRELLAASESNLTDAHMTEGAHGDQDVHYFLDMTMAVLGESAAVYQTYARKIQAEYSHLQTNSYLVLRSKVLKSLLLMPNIYATKDFQTEREAIARENIQAEIDNCKV
ncbi:unnamed protein product [Meganyctiphanes norvegica]|uniref:Uncharacterized protein n=1 Tax=Meganyctiphanes norvegica TaxID=48144 RepID=A0AAV2QIA7_MEGNR